MLPEEDIVLRLNVTVQVLARLVDRRCDGAAPGAAEESVVVAFDSYDVGSSQVGPRSSLDHLKLAPDLVTHFASESSHNHVTHVNYRPLERETPSGNTPSSVAPVLLGSNRTSGQ